MYNKFLGYLIKAIRDIFDMTQKELAKTIDKSEIAIRKYESGQINIPFTVLFIILKILDIDISFLKNIVDEIKIELVKNKILNEMELKDCLEQFNIDVARIYKLNIDDINLNDYKSIEEIKIIFDRQVSEYIENYLGYLAKDLPIEKYIKILENVINEKKIKNEVINFLNYNIEKYYKYKLELIDKINK